jgi:hypothetical protein
VLHEIVAEPTIERSTALQQYADALATALDRGTPDGDLDPAVVDAVESGTVADLTVEEAAVVLGADPERPGADVIVAEAIDDLLLSMTTAVVDVDRVAARVDGLTPRDVQQKVEGRASVTLAEYADIRRAIAD